MALILQIETSTTSCSAALARDGEILSVKEVNQPNVHASSLTLFINEVLQSAGVRMEQVEAVAVSMGPGSYTGLRIGVSTAKGICYAMDIPLISVNTLEAMAWKMKGLGSYPDALFCPMIDARRMEVYTAVYDQELQMISPVEAKIIDESSFAELLKSHRIVFFGDGADKCREVLGLSPNALFADDFFNSSSGLTSLAYRNYQNSRFEDTAYFEPYYLKDFIAGNPAAGKKI
ncbi:tRNA (adenosine(37)-N6)-threonylcarbamoyltransferase complex dimerization subunit type 1 TsaB [Pararcticibacter amylolyticus]|uniref:tRNA (Adenosine(37)-N6)-threonylcarbamoyltransferase complex dimerization subunit type 1 TsaB n=1 Tax=Pararcticibacter amylolyticus TaxID=2173175 RepID=A0A2U2PHI3_9SPHI|nr:tRNA (adenosine(37)-N6)-threonylcarbamoyltransferase complex dimerization subunit type 1 TsaB [Pararcticibacter amylolyticus]PWG80866.1 tRNA (adenosine(37)-N6)-threonylcarbamoyltransferase complex dimerization subunit type 1 TsaB [Pararcticibacter amylolyticus]